MAGGAGQDAPTQMSENRYRTPPGNCIVVTVMDDEHCYRAASSRDGRFDGTFVTAVLTTGIYCRPSCPAMTPKRENVRFFPTPAAAQEAGFRACKRCRPDAAPGSPEWDSRADLVARAVRLIGDGVVEREGVVGVSRRLGYSSRQLHRLVSAELGTGPLRLAMAHRVQNARALLENTDLPVTQVAWASGFGSIRQFNDRIREVFALTPSEIRARRSASRPGGSEPGAPGEPGQSGQSGQSGQPDQSSQTDQPSQTRGTGQTVTAQLTYRPPLDLHGALDFLGRRAVPGVEWWDGSAYTRVLDLPHGPGMALVDVGSARQSGPASHPAVRCHIRLHDIRDYATAVSRMRRLLDLDADPAAVAALLGEDPVLGPIVRAAPGRRLPGAVSPFEMAVRAVIGQQVSLASARATLGRIAAFFGRPVELMAPILTPGEHPHPGSPYEPPAGPFYAFPRAEDLAGADPSTLALPRRRAETLIALAGAVASDRITLDPGADRDETERRLLELPGVGPWTAAYIRMRALGDPDVFPPGDLVLDRVLAGGTGDARSSTRGAGAARQADGRPAPGASYSRPDAPRPNPVAWKPWRSYAVAHLWATAAATAAATAGADPAAGPRRNPAPTPRRSR